jgi:hypothetical protein
MAEWAQAWPSFSAFDQSHPDDLQLVRDSALNTGAVVWVHVREGNTAIATKDRHKLFLSGICQRHHDHVPEGKSNPLRQTCKHDSDKCKVCNPNASAKAKYGVQMQISQCKCLA